MDTKSNAKLKKNFGTIEVLTIGIGAMIGWSWLIYPSVWINNSGPLGAVIAFCLAGSFNGLISLTYAGLSPMMPKAGGPLLYSWRALGPNFSMICGWALLLVYALYTTYYPISIINAIKFLFDFPDGIVLWTIAGYPVSLNGVLIGGVMTLIITGINCAGGKSSGAAQNATVIGMIAVAIIFFFFSFKNGDVANMEPKIKDGLGGIGKTFLLAPLFMGGFDAIPQAAEEAKIPAKSLGKCIIATIAFGVFWYSFVNLACGMAIPAKEIAGSQLAVADAMLAVTGGSKIWANILVVAGIFGIISSWNATVIGASRVFYAMASGGQVPRIFGYIHPKTHVPVYAILFVCILCLVMPLLGSQAIMWVTDAAALAIFITFTITALSFLRLRKIEPNLDRPFKVKHGVAIGRIAVLFGCFGLTLFMPFGPCALSVQAWAFVVAWTIIGLIFGIRNIPKKEQINANYSKMLRIDEKTI